MSPKPTKYNFQGNIIKLNAVRTPGVNRTNITNNNDASAEKLSVLFPKGPILNNERSERILKL